MTTTIKKKSLMRSPKWTRSRRGFLCNAASAGLAFTLLSRAAKAQTSERKLVIALAYGGWDPLYALDPKPDSPDVDLIAGDVQNFGGLPIWVDSSRPQVTQFFTQHASRAIVFNGVAVESLAHETCIDVMLAGAPDAKRPDIAARVAHALGSQDALPYLALSPQAQTGRYVSEAGELGATNQLMALTTPEFSWPNRLGFPQEGARPNDGEQSAIDFFIRQRTEQLRQAHIASSRSQGLLSDYVASQNRMEKLLSNARANGMLSNQALFNDVSGPWRHVAAALAEGVSRVALVQPNLFWDTHEFNQQQGGSFDSLFGGLNLLMAELQEQGISDETTVLVVSEMGRTPIHNRSQGKDHWPWSSAIIIDSQLSGGRVVGETNHEVRPLPVNLATGQTEATGERLHAEHILSTVAELAGLQGNEWFSRPPITGALL